MIKKYLVEHETGAGMVVEIDEEILTEEELHKLNDFWCGAKDNLYREDGNVLNAVLKNLLQVVLSVQYEGGLNLQGVINAFDWDAKYGNGGQEGYPKLDGSSGIKLVDVTGLEIDVYDIEIKEVV